MEVIILFRKNEKKRVQENLIFFAENELDVSVYLLPSNSHSL